MSNDIKDWIESQGWKPHKVNEYESHDFVWYKRFPHAKPRCYCNSSKPGIQLSLKMYDLRDTLNLNLSFQLHLVAEAKDGTWVDLTTYGLSEAEIKDGIEIQAKKLLAAWTAIDSVNPTEEK